MAELTIEQKAKAYDEALVRMKSWVRGEHPECFDNAQKTAEFIFPVLKNEDERIKKWLYNIIKNGSFLGEIPFEKTRVLAWIEKQGEKKPTPIFRIGDTIIAKDGTYIEKEPFHIDKIEDDCYWDGENTILVCNQDEFEIFEQKTVDKVEPKFEIEKGKWYVCNTSRYTDFVVGKAYQCPKNGMLKPNENEIARYVAKHCFRPWTIDDAKEGDVLVASDGTLFILAKKLGDAVTDHASLSKATKGLIISAGNYRYEVANVCRPATKEEIDIMVQRIDAAGYRWDDKAKELVRKEENKGVKEGDWLMPKGDYKPSGHAPFRISDKNNGTFHIEDSCGFLVDTWLDTSINNYYRKWTIGDAKNGDILVGGGCMVIFKEIDGLNIRCHCTYHFMYNEAFYTNTLQNKDVFRPATQKQRVTMRKAMTAEGYTFDFEKKELKKVDNEPIDKVEPKFEVGDTMRTLQEAANGVTEGLPVIVSIDNSYYRCNNECIAIKDQDNYEYPPMNRGQNPAWGEEDERKLNDAIRIIENSGNVESICKHYVDFLKSLKDRFQLQPTWKPSEEQLDALHDAAAYVDKSMFPYPKGILMKLYKQLKKLKG